MAQHVLELARARPRADRHQRGAEHGHREADQQPLRPVVHEHGHHVAALHAGAQQPPGQLAHLRARFRIGQPPGPLAVHDQLVRGLAPGHLVEQVGQGPGGGPGGASGHDGREPTSRSGRAPAAA